MGPNLAPLASIGSALALWIYYQQVRSAEAGVRVLTATRGSDPDAAVPAPTPVPGQVPVGYPR
jgi:hypothetical protein